MREPTKRLIHFHGELANKFQQEPLEIYADSVFNLINILYKCVYPELIDEKGIEIVFEDVDGNKTYLVDAEQELHKSQTNIHLIPNPDGAYIQIVYYIIAMIVAVGVSLLLAPKTEFGQETASGANWETPENVVGQGGVIPVVLGEILTGSRVASYGIDATVFRSTI